MRSFFALVIVALMVVPGVARAQNSSPVVVELYTSQGCSSCPPADRYLTQLASRPDVIALGMHVDIWDYLGWKDQFGRRENTQRQREYARVAHRRSIYTPEMIIQGTDSVIGRREGAVEALIAAHKARAAIADIAVKRTGGGITVALTPMSGRVPRASIILVRFRESAEVQIERGENGGKTLRYSNIVTDFDEVGSWDGASASSVQIGNVGNEPLAVLLQLPGNGAILAAASLR